MAVVPPIDQGSHFLFILNQEFRANLIFSHFVLYLGRWELSLHTLYITDFGSRRVERKDKEERREGVGGRRGRCVISIGKKEDR